MKPFFSALLLLCAGFAATAGPLKTKLKYVRDIAPCDKPGTLAATRLDKDIYDKINGFSEIRILNSAGKEVPFRTRLSRATQTKTIKIPCASKIVSLKRLKGNKIEIIVKNTEKTRIPISLEIRTPNKNYDKKISISTGDGTNGEWVPSTNAHSVFDYSAIIALSNKTVPLPKHPTGKFYKITISNFSETKQSRRMRIVTERRSGKDFSEIKKVMRFNDVFKIDRIIFTAEENKLMKKTPILENAESAIIANSVENRDTIVVLQTFSQPITRLELKTPSVNFSRKLSLLSSDDKKQWSPICEGLITKVSVGTYIKTSMRLNLPETRSKYLKIIIHNQDAPPIKISAVKCSRNAYVAEFIIPADSETRLKFYYAGNVPAPRYDIDAVLANLKNPVPLFLELEPEKLNPDYSPAAPAGSFWNSATLMYILIGVVAAFLCILLFSGIKKIDTETV
jgi:hypothetical protein